MSIQHFLFVIRAGATGSVGFTAILVMALMAPGVHGEPPGVDERPAKAGDWGFRPPDGQPTAQTPPRFSWRPQDDAASYTLQVARDEAFEDVIYEAADLSFNVHSPPREFPAGEWFWRFRYETGDGTTSAWSKVRRFEIEEDAVAFPLPNREELLSRIPDGHPRLFTRPEDVSRLRELAGGKLKAEYQQLVERSERLMEDPPSTEEPPKYPPDVERKSERWREIWWGNRKKTIRVLNGAATLGFTYLLSGEEAYGEKARELLLAAAEWDPKGSTGYRYNDEAGMPYAYYFSRTYTFIHDLLSEQQRRKCREVMRVRGRAMYEHLHPRHLWRPYSSHSNRAWHFLGEVGIAFHGEIEAADDWTWFAMNVFANVYPVWSDADGGWHEGLTYWRSYINRFTWWADVMREAMGIDAYRKPYFSKAGYFPLYVQPPGTGHAGFGDLTPRRSSSSNVNLMAVLAAQAQNRHWQWYVEAHDKEPASSGYIGFIRAGLKSVEPKAPSDLPQSRLFEGIGQAALNTDLTDTEQNVELLFKSSPFGTQSHGYEAQNGFMLHVAGDPVLIRTGYRDIYGSDHHKNWMWHTKSDNSILVNGEGQGKRTASAKGRITRFQTGESIDYVEGEAQEAYGEKLDQFRRGMLFIKPGVIVIFDRLEAPEPATYQWLLHAPNEMRVDGQRRILAHNGDGAARVSLLFPSGLKVSQTDKFDPPPRDRVDLTEYHLTAETPSKSRRQRFVAVVHPHRRDAEPPESAQLSRIEGGYAVEAPLSDGKAVVLLRTESGAILSFKGVEAEADVAAVRFDDRGDAVERFATDGGEIRLE